VRLSVSTLEFPITKTTKLLVNTRSGTRAKRIHTERLMSSCRAPLTRVHWVYNPSPAPLIAARRSSALSRYRVKLPQRSTRHRSIGFVHVTHSGVGGGTHHHRPTFERCKVFVRGVRLGVWGVVLVARVCRGSCSLSVCVCVTC